MSVSLIITDGITTVSLGDDATAILGTYFPKTALPNLEYGESKSGNPPLVGCKYDNVVETGNSLLLGGYNQIRTTLHSLNILFDSARKYAINGTGREVRVMYKNNELDSYWKASILSGTVEFAEDALHPKYGATGEGITNLSSDVLAKLPITFTFVREYAWEKYVAYNDTALDYVGGEDYYNYNVDTVVDNNLCGVQLVIANPYDLDGTDKSIKVYNATGSIYSGTYNYVDTAQNVAVGEGHQIDIVNLNTIEGDLPAKVGLRFRQETPTEFNLPGVNKLFVAGMELDTVYPCDPFMPITSDHIITYSTNPIVIGSGYYTFNNVDYTIGRKLMSFNMRNLWLQGSRKPYKLLLLNRQRGTNDADYIQLKIKVEVYREDNGSSSNWGAVAQPSINNVFTPVYETNWINLGDIGDDFIKELATINVPCIHKSSIDYGETIALSIYGRTIDNSSKNLYVTNFMMLPTDSYKTYNILGEQEEREYDIVDSPLLDKVAPFNVLDRGSLVIDPRKPYRFYFVWLDYPFTDTNVTQQPYRVRMWYVPRRLTL